MNIDIRLAPHNASKIMRMVRSADLPQINLYNVANLAIQVGLPSVRKLLVKPQTTTKKRKHSK